MIKYLVTNKANIRIIEKDINILKNTAEETKCLIKNILELVGKKQTDEDEPNINVLDKIPITDLNILDQIESDLCNRDCYRQLVSY